MILILAPSRSGTTYTAKLLQSAGLDIKHENIGKDGGIGWQFCANTMYNKKRTDWRDIEFDLVIQQTRHPLPTISSIITHEEGMMRFIAKDIGTESTGLELAMRYWIEWTLRANEKAEFTYQVENMETVWPNLIKLICPEKKDLTMPEIPQNTNSRKHDNLTWHDLFECNNDLAANILELSKKMGYEQ